MSQKHIKQHFVFDLDETLVDSREFCAETIARVIKKFHPGIKSKHVKMLHNAHGGSTIVDHYKRIASEFNLTTDIGKLLECDAQIQIQEVERMQLFDGVVDILQYLKKGNKHLHMLTNRKKDTLIPILTYTGIAEYFTSITSCVDEGYKKPDPTCLHTLITDNGGKKDNFIYFGDTKIDKEFAKNAGIDFVVFDQYLNDKNLFKKLIGLFAGNAEEKSNTPGGKSFFQFPRFLRKGIKNPLDLVFSRSRVHTLKSPQ